jgi:hypothetical protein
MGLSVLARHQLYDQPRQLSDRPADALSSAISKRPRSQAGPPMTLGNMRANGVRSRRRRQAALPS